MSIIIRKVETQSASLLSADDEDDVVRDLWVKVKGLPENTVYLGFQMNHERVDAYTRLIDDGLVVLVVERLLAYNYDKSSASWDPLRELLRAIKRKQI